MTGIMVEMDVRNLSECPHSTDCQHRRNRLVALPVSSLARGGAGQPSQTSQQAAA